MYKYEDLKPTVFTENGQEMFLKIRDQISYFLKISGAVRMQEALTGTYGDSWESMACVDRLIELGEIKEITGPETIGQHRVFISAKTIND